MENNKKSFAQLKRDLHKGMLLKCTYHAIRPERIGQVNEVNIVQTNAFTTLQERDGEIKDCWLYFPKSANLIEYIGNTITFYEGGIRNVDVVEQAGINKLNTMEYWQKQKYAKENGIEYLLGYEEVKGKKLIHDYDENRNVICKIRDNSIKGEKLYSFEIVTNEPKEEIKEEIIEDKGENVKMEGLEEIKTKYEIKENKEKNGIELYFEKIPNKKERDVLKENGFKFHNMKKCWYKRLNNTTEEIDTLKEEIKELKDIIEDKEQTIETLDEEMQELQLANDKFDVIEDLKEYFEDNGLLTEEIKNTIDLFTKFYV